MSEKPASWNCDWHSAPGDEFGLGSGCMNCDDNFAKQQKRFAEERARVDRWHCTLNACLSGAHSNGYRDQDVALREMEWRVRDARLIADLVHGPLVKP